jgi:hypothetical protein
MFRLEPLLGTVRGYLFLKSGHRLFPDRYLNGTVFCTVLTHLQTGSKRIGDVAVCLACSVPCTMLQRAKAGIDLIQKEIPPDSLERLP